MICMHAIVNVLIKSEARAVISRIKNTYYLILRAHIFTVEHVFHMY